MAVLLRSWMDGPNLVEQYLEDGKLYTKQVSLNETALMEENAAIRNNGGPRKMGWARPLLQLSETQYKLVTKMNPDLTSPDPQTQRKAWRALAEKFPGLRVVEKV